MTVARLDIGCSVKSLVNRLVFRMANRWPERNERRWAWRFLYYELEVRK